MMKDPISLALGVRARATLEASSRRHSRTKLLPHTEVTCLTSHPFDIDSFPFRNVSPPHSLLLFPWIISQINYLHSYPCLRICYQGASQESHSETPGTASARCKPGRCVRRTGRICKLSCMQVYHVKKRARVSSNLFIFLSNMFY